VQEATTGPPVAFYDYIIVGGGAAGCALAATLSQHAAVLVLERGGSPYNNTNITNVANFVSTISDTSPDSPSQTFVSEDGVYNTRARVLGGGSAIGAGFYSRAEANFIRRTGWDQELVRRSYEWVEWKVGFEPEVKQWQTAVREGMVETGIGPYNGFTYAHDYGTKIGGTTFDMMGQRHSAADLLEYARPRNIKVYLHATVTKILFHRVVRRWPRPIAYGVVYEDSMGIRRKAILKPHPHNEVILAAGAIGSPQLMMLSGIGPGLHLRSHGIQVVVDQPNTGKPSSLTAETIERAIETVQAYANTSQTTGGVILQKVKGPLSSGDLKLRSTIPHEDPSVSFNYYTSPRDLEGFAKLRYPNLPVQALVDLVLNLPVNLRPRHVSSSISLEQFCKDTVMTMWDYHGGCQVGRVVDPEYRVIGVDGLRVVDGSTLLRSPGTNPQATIMMLGR
ncbi:(R)-mandelonitrile lyase-like, partial [Linum grandiflorum]